MNLGTILCDVKGDYDGAIAAFKEAIRLDPKDADAHANLGVALRGKGDADGAIASSRRRSASTRRTPAHNSLGAILCDVKGTTTERSPLSRRRSASCRRTPMPTTVWGTPCGERGTRIGASPAFRRRSGSIRRRLAAHNNLAWLLAAGPDRVRDGKRAVEHAARSCELTAWKVPTSIHTLAAAHAEAGDFDKAIEFQKKALSFPAYEKRFGNDGREHFNSTRRRSPSGTRLSFPARPPRAAGSEAVAQRVATIDFQHIPKRP